MFLKFAGVKLGDSGDSNTRIVELLAPAVSKNIETLELIGATTPVYKDLGGQLTINVKVEHQFQNEDSALKFAFARAVSLLDIGVGALEISDWGGLSFNFADAALENCDNVVNGVAVEFTYQFKVTK